MKYPVDISFVFILLIKQKAHKNEQDHWEKHCKLENSYNEQELEALYEKIMTSSEEGV